MNKKQIQKRVTTKEGKPLALDRFEWDEDALVFSTKENNLKIDFSEISRITIITGWYCEITAGDACDFITGGACTFKTGNNCRFNTAGHCEFTTEYYCQFITGPSCKFITGKNSIIITCGYSSIKTEGKSAVVNLLDSKSVPSKKGDSISLGNLGYNYFLVNGKKVRGN